MPQRWPLFVVVLAVSLLACNGKGDDASGQPGPSFTFAAGGDHGTSDATDDSLELLDESDAEFYLALGDLDYDGTPTDAAWCEYILDSLETKGSRFPFQLLVGNHEQQNGSDGYIMNHRECLPDRLNSTGFYAVEYYFDYPSDEPIARIIMVPPDLTVENVTYEYEVGNEPYEWLEDAIDSAREENIPWVIVGMHKNCISTGQKSCEMGRAIMNLVHEEKVDLVLQGHDHNYQRTKQLAHGTGCPRVLINSYDSDCVADDGSDGEYEKGEGAVTVISGNFGHCCYAVNADDAEAGYFAEIDDTSDGFVQFTVNREEIEAVSMPSTGSYVDSFTITGASDDDGDGSSAALEQYVGTSQLDPCGEHLHPSGASVSWPLDLVTGGIPASANRVTITDLMSFVSPVRRLDATPPEPEFDVRWDLAPGAGILGARINIQDLTELVTQTPPMFGGSRAFNGPLCTG